VKNGEVDKGRQYHSKENNVPSAAKLAQKMKGPSLK